MDNNMKKSDKNMDKNANANAKKSNDVEFANEMDAKNNKTNCK